MKNGLRKCSSSFRLQPSSLFSESAAAVGERVKASMATLLSAHLLRDGEIVLLILKPSLWFILLSSLRFIAVVLIVMIGSRIYSESIMGSARTHLEVGAFLVF